MSENDAGNHVPSDALLAGVINGMSDAFDRELFDRTKDQLEELWHFKFDAAKSIESNIYNFTDLLGLYERQVERWESHHNGSCCVVERVRDQYLWPKIRRFADDLRAVLTANMNDEVRP